MAVFPNPGGMCSRPPPPPPPTGYSLKSRTSSVRIKSSSLVKGNWVSGSFRRWSDRERSMKKTRMAWGEEGL